MQLAETPHGTVAPIAGATHTAGSEPGAVSHAHPTQGGTIHMQSTTARRLWTLTLTLVVGLTGFAVLSGTASASVPAPPAGFSLTWSDDFTGAAGTGVNTGNWLYDTGPGSNFGTGEIETMTNSTANVFQDGAGNLIIKAIHASGSAPTAGWTSGRIETQAATYGAPAGGVVLMQSSIQQPDSNLNTGNGLGYWPAFWMLGAPLRSGVAWPGSGEIDILEDVNAQSVVYGTLHCGTASGGPCNETSGIGSGAHGCSGCQTGFHTYGVQIDRSISPEQIRWYLDGTNYFTVNANQVDATTWANAVDHPFFIIYDLAMGGGFPNGVSGQTTPTAATVSGGQMKVDYVAVYNKGAGGGDTTPPSTPANLAASGTTSSSTNLSWSASTDNVGVTGYDVIENGNTITTVSGTSTTVSGLAASTTYSFQVKARDAAGNLSAASNTVSVTTSASGGGGTNIAQGKPTTASSLENSTFPASNATDGNTGTRWSSAFSDPQWIQVDLGQSYNVTSVNLNWEAAYGKSFQIQVSPDASTWTTIYSTTTGTGGNQTLSVSGTGRYIRMYGTARGTQYGYSLWEFGVTGTPAGGSTLLSQGHPATASSTENATFPASSAVDGNTGTRWSSAFSDPQWIYVDLGAVHSVSQVVLNWETACGKSFQLQSSNDASTWSTFYSTTTGAGGVQTIPVTASGRYIRMYGTARCTQYGYSLWEFQVFGT
jgi:chitodextrinase